MRKAIGVQAESLGPGEGNWRHRLFPKEGEEVPGRAPGSEDSHLGARKKGRRDRGESAPRPAQGKRPSTTGPVSEKKKQANSRRKCRSPVTLHPRPHRIEREKKELCSPRTFSPMGKKRGGDACCIRDEKGKEKRRDREGGASNKRKRTLGRSRWLITREKKSAAPSRRLRH